MGSDLAENRSVFEIRNYRLAFLGALTSELGALLYSFAASFYILEISGNDAFLQGLYLALGSAAMVAFTPVGGVLGDRCNKATIMYSCDYLKGGLILVATALMLLLPEPRSQLAILFAVGVLGNVVSGIFNPAASALLPHIVEEKRLQQANAFFAMKSSLEGILGIVLAGVLYAVLPIHALFLLVGACYLASGVSEMQIRYDRRLPHSRLTLRLAIRDMADGLGYLRTSRAIVALLGAILFVNFFFAPVTGNFLPFFVKTDLAGAPSYLFDEVLTPELWSSVFSACFGISSLLGAAVLSTRMQQDKCGRKTALRLCATSAVMIALTVCYWLLVDLGASLNGFLVAMGLVCLAMGGLISLINIPVNTALMRAVDKDKLSKVMSIVGIGSQGMIPLAAMLAGLVLKTLGSTPLLAICSAGFAATAIALLHDRRIDEI